MSPDDPRPGDERFVAAGLTFLISPRDRDFAEHYGGLLVDENRFWGGVSVRPLWGGGSCGS